MRIKHEDWFIYLPLTFFFLVFLALTACCFVRYFVYEKFIPVATDLSRLLSYLD